MKIPLYKRQYVVIAEQLTWSQVQEAEQKANASEAAKHYWFYRHKSQSSTDDIRPWLLLAMPQVIMAADRGEDVTGWVIEIQDFVRRTS